MSTAACLAVSTTPTTAAVTAPTAPTAPTELPSDALSACPVCALVSVTASGAGAGAGVGVTLNGDSGRAGARYTLFRLPSLSISVGRSSVVVHLPSTIYLYATFSPQGIWTMPSKKPELDLVR